jgi:hypothetical protein
MNGGAAIEMFGTVSAQRIRELSAQLDAILAALRKEVEEPA